MSQKERLRKLLKDGHAMTPLRGLQWLGTFRLSGRIKDLRDEGMLIETRIVKRNGKRYASYRIAA